MSETSIISGYVWMVKHKNVSSRLGNRIKPVVGEESMPLIIMFF